MKIRQKTKKALPVMAVIALFILFFSPLLITRARMFSHDTIWFYGIFHYFSESIMNNVFPYWDPYNYAGQPFYPNISIMHLINTVAIFVVNLNRALNLSLLTLYHWYVMAEIVFAGIGVYFFTAGVTKNRVSALAVFFIFLFSSFTYITLRQGGFIYAFMWLPWTIFFLTRMVRETAPYNTIGFGLFLGLAMTGYQGLYVVVFTAAFTLSLTLNKRRFFTALLNKKNMAGLLAAFLMVGFLSSPLIAFFIDKNAYAPMARMRTSPEATESYTNRTGSVPSKAADFLGLVSRPIAIRGYFEKKIPLSEGFLYIGILPLILAAIGLIMTRNEFRINFLFTIAATILLMLGPKGALQSIVNSLFPPFKYIRHMQLFAGFFIFNLLYFTGQGCDYLIERIGKRSWARSAIIIVGLSIVLDLFSYGKQAFPLVTLPRGKMKFSEYPEIMAFRTRRGERIVSYDDIRYFKPSLYGKRTAFNAVTVPKQYSGAELNFNLFELYRGVKEPGMFVFSTEARAKNVKNFIEYGVANISGWDKDSRLAFVDILHVVITDMITHGDFYSLFHSGLERCAAARALIEAGSRQIKRGSGDMAFLTTAWSYIEPVIDLKLAFSRGGGTGKMKFVFMGRHYNFKKRVSIHGYMYKGIPAAGYIERLWNSGHVEEFTLLLKKNYEKLMRLAVNTGMGGPYHTVKRIAGVSGDIIRFYTKAEPVFGDDVLGMIRDGSLKEDTVYLDADTGRPTGGASPAAAAAAGAPFSYNIKSYDANTLELEYVSSSPGFLYYSDGYDKYWGAFIDGRPTGIFRANQAFKAVTAPKGEHIVKFQYNPRGFRLSLFLYYLAAVAGIAYLFFFRGSSLLSRA